MRLLLLATCLGLTISSTAMADYFRYKNKDGNTVISYTLTKEAILAGYDILNDQGMIVKSVHPASKTEDFQAERQQREKDILLLSTYGSLTEFETSIKRRAEQHEKDVQQLNNKIKEARTILAQAEDKAGKEERARGEASRATLAALNTASASLKRIEQQLQSNSEKWLREQEETQAQRERFKTLLER